MNSDWKLIHGIIVSHWNYAGKTILQRAKILNSVIWEVICTEMTKKNRPKSFTHSHQFSHTGTRADPEICPITNFMILPFCILCTSPNWSRILPDYKYYLVWPICTAYPGQKNLKLWTVVQNLTTLNSSSDNRLEMYKLSTWCFLSYLAASIFTWFRLLNYPSSDSTESSWRMGLSDGSNICRGDNLRNLHSMAVHKHHGRTKNHSWEVGWRIAYRMTHSC